MQKYPWCSGVDIDLERGGFENREAANLLFKDIYDTVKEYDKTKLANICLPCMTAINGSVGDENWCVCHPQAEHRRSAGQCAKAQQHAQ